MEQIKNWFKRPQVWGFFLSMAVMAVISVVFFYPDNFEGNSLRQADMMQGAANGHEAQQWQQQTGEQALWTNSLFGGMPTFQISPVYPSNKLFTWLDSLYGLGLPAPSNLLFMMMFGFLILLFVMGLQWYYALIGAVAWGFSSYFIIIIGAGHIWKFVALTYIPPTIAGLVLTYRGRYIAGAAMTALFAMLQLNANHPQMSYYFALVMAALVIAWLIEALRNKTVKRWAVATAITLGAGALAIGANLPSLYNTYEYAKETKRAQSELTPPASETASGDADSHRPTGGMPYKDIVGWSYTPSETLTLLVPNAKGGASAKPEAGQMTYMSLSHLDDARQYDNTAAGSILPYLPQYFNDTEGTNGPVYVGAAVCLLFLIGCFIIKGPVKWALLVMTVLSILLAWGRHFDMLTDLFIYNFPLYNKFRAVESILVIAEFTMPLMAILALAKLLSSPSPLKEYKKALAISTAVCSIICLAAWIAPAMFGGAISEEDRAMATNIGQQYATMAVQQGYDPVQAQQMAYQLSLANPENAEAVSSLRYGLTSADGLRSLFFILIAAGAVFGYYKGWCRRRWAVAIIGVTVLIDLFNVNRRYIDHSSFVAVTADTPDFVPDAIDRLILQDTTTYRVMDIPGFTLPDRSYFHHTVGGYHAAKLNRYEDLIQRHLALVSRAGYYPELRIDSIAAAYPDDHKDLVASLRTGYRVLDMLNARYIITGDSLAPVLANTSALGNAWLVHDISYVKNADEEMKALESLDPARAAVADERFSQTLGQVTGSLAPGDTIMLTSYTPNRLTYSCVTASPAIGVFSEVYFPWGWKATIDGNAAPIGRVNYILRALAIPAGHHEIVMTFDPDSLHITGGIAYASVSLIYLLVLAALFFTRRRCDKASTVS